MDESSGTLSVVLGSALSVIMSTRSVPMWQPSGLSQARLFVFSGGRQRAAIELRPAFAQNLTLPDKGSQPAPLTLR